MMTEFRNYYLNNFDIEFFGDIPCAAHVINLIVNDIMSAIKLNAPKSDEITIYINDTEKLAKKKDKKPGQNDLPGTIQKFIKYVKIFTNFYRFTNARNPENSQNYYFI